MKEHNKIIPIYRYGVTKSDAVVLLPRLEQKIGVMLMLTTDYYETEHMSIMHVLINSHILIAKLHGHGHGKTT